MLPDMTVFSYQELLIIDAKSLSEVSKHERAVLLELEMAGHVLSENTRSDTVMKCCNSRKSNNVCEIS